MFQFLRDPGYRLGIVTFAVRGVKIMFKLKQKKISEMLVRELLVVEYESIQKKIVISHAIKFVYYKFVLIISFDTVTMFK